MLLNLTPSGNELQRKLLLSHASRTRTVFIICLLLSVGLALYIGSYYSKVQIKESPFIRNIAKIEVPSVGTGTAFLLTSGTGTHNGYLMTAGHVVCGAQDGEKVSLTFEQITDDKGEPLVTTGSIKWKSDVSSYDPYTVEKMRMDVALIELDDKTILPEDVIGFSIKPDAEMNEEIMIYGFPKGEEYSSTGIVSSLKYSDCEDLITMDIQLVGGLSGAPVFNKETGEVIGMAIGSRVEFNEGVTESGEAVLVKGQNDLFNSAIKMQRVIEILDAAGKLNLIQ